LSFDAQLTRLRHKLKYRVRWQRVAVLGVALFLLFAMVSCMSLMTFFKALHTKVTDPEYVQDPLPGDRINILVLGLDEPQDETGKVITADLRSGWSRSDVMMVISIDPETRDVGVLSIPRDTRVKISGKGTMEKIAHAHIIGGPKNGPLVAMRTVRDFLGIDLRYYVRTNVQGFERIVDILGGIEIDVPQDMLYYDPTQNLKIDLKAGRQVLDGEKAIQFVRFREYANADIGRIQAQQMFINAMVKRAFSLGTVFRLPALSSELAKQVDTNLDTGQMLNLAALAARLDRDRIETGTVPGVPQTIDGLDYWIPDAPKTRLLAERLIRGIDRAANAKVKIEVLNGTPTAGLATKMAGRLRALGYDVIKVDNADRRDHPYTRVINHNGDEEGFKRLTRAVVRLSPQAKPFHIKAASASGGVMVTVIVGADFK
jgi:LCP family protein required for cell wall assembly